MSNSLNTLFVGKVLLQFKELASTNTYAIELIAKNKPSEGTVISAWSQPQGRGQIGSKWESEAGKNLTISLILYPTFLPARQQFLLNQVISLAVRDFVATYLSSVTVKWPNDIYVKHKKIAGILIQNVLSSSSIQSSTIGIGININQRSFLPETSNPTALILETGHPHDLSTLLAELCEYLERRYLQLRAQQYSIIEKDYLQHLYRYQQEALYRRNIDSTIFSGKIVGLAPTGKLLIDHHGGQEAFDIREISFLQ